MSSHTRILCCLRRCWASWARSPSLLYVSTSPETIRNPRESKQKRKIRYSSFYRSTYRGQKKPLIIPFEEFGESPQPYSSRELSFGAKRDERERASLLVVDGDCAPGGRRRLQSRERKPAEAAGAHLSGGGAAARPGPGEAAGETTHDATATVGREHPRLWRSPFLSSLLWLVHYCRFVDDKNRKNGDERGEGSGPKRSRRRFGGRRKRKPVWNQQH